MIRFTLSAFLFLSEKKEAYGLLSAKLAITHLLYWNSPVLAGRDHTSSHVPDGFSAQSLLGYSFSVFLQEFAM